MLGPAYLEPSQWFAEGHDRTPDMRAHILRFIAALGLVVAAGPAMAQFSSDEAAIRQVLGRETAEQAWFTQQFLDQVPLARIRQITEATRQAIGPVTEIEKQGDGYLVRTETHEMPVLITRDASGAIAGMLLQPAVPREVGIGAATAALDELAGQVAYLVTRNGEVVASRDADVPLAVGSAFKLAVLKALREKLDAGEAAWDQVIALEPRQISLPTGTLQMLPPGAPVTIHTLAALMIAISDNTATDALIDFVGRGPIAELLGTPVLKTRELFILKSDAELRQRYLAATAQEREALHAELDAHALPAASAVPNLHVDGIEYYVALTRLCALMDDLDGEQVLGLNPGLARPEDWSSVAFKGGSEGGVLNLTTRVLDRSGTPWCVAMSWNDDTALDETKGYTAYSALLAAVRNAAQAP